MLMTFRQIHGEGSRIAENEWCIAKRCTAPGVDSCLVIVAPVAGDKKFILHLVQVQYDYFTDEDADSVLRIMTGAGADVNNVTLRGAVGDWENSDNAACQRLLNRLNVTASGRRHSTGSIEIGD